MTFSSELLVERTPAGSKSRVKQEGSFPPPLPYSVGGHMGECVYVADYMCTIYVRSDSLAAVLISDQEYPDRVGFTLLHKVCAISLSAPRDSSVCMPL